MKFPSRQGCMRPSGASRHDKQNNSAQSLGANSVMREIRQPILTDIVDANDPLAWSGIPYHMLQGAATLGDFAVCGPLSERTKWTVSPTKILEKLGRGKIHLARFGMVRSSFARQISRFVARHGGDFVISPSSVPVSRLPANIPYVFWTDACFPQLVDFYQEFSELHPMTVRAAILQETEALKGCELALYSSDWAADCARELCPEAADRIEVVKYGANLEPAEGSPTQTTFNPDDGVCRLLFLAVEWERKRGDVAVAICQRLIELGIRAELHIVGLSPFNEDDKPAFVRQHGFISKATREGRQQLRELFSDAHFLLLPTAADCSPIVICEAFAFATPPVTTRVGGIGSYVRDGDNGLLFSPEEEPDVVARGIRDVLVSADEYARLSQNAFASYRDETNWKSAWKRVIELLEARDWRLGGRSEMSQPNNRSAVAEELTEINAN